VPIVQAGERILFAVENGVVTAHIQIQYAGDAKDFGWLLPLPSVPTLKLGTEELFAQLISTTQPRYFVRNTFTGNCGGIRNATAAGFSGSESQDAGSSSPLVTESSIGPYDYAVLKADSKEAMFKWLTDNHYFIPTGTDETVGPYINPGSYFLALKLKSGRSAGDIQPVVLTYPSDLPMIPIILTSLAAVPNMGIQVWMLGASRAIPRNYNHVVINDAQIDWLGQARNYNEVVIRAISETPEKHAFITEYAGTTAIMRDVLDPSGRFGSSGELAALTDPGQFVSYLFTHGFPNGINQSGAFGRPLPPVVKNLVLAMVPVPEKLTGVSEDAWLQNLSNYLGAYRETHPEQFVGWSSTFDAPALAAQLDEKVVRPAREAGELFRRFPKMTRLYTALSPQDMTRDPVFSFNPSLPDVSRDHTAELRTDCNLFTGSQNAPRTLITEQGWAFRVTSEPRDLTSGPGALRIETLSEEGDAKVLVDNSAMIDPTPACGCASVDALGLGALGLLAATLRRRRSTPAAS